MRGFVFKLERLLRLRTREEDEVARRLGLALQVQEETGREVEAAEEYLTRCHLQTAELAAVSAAGNQRNLELASEAASQRLRSARADHEAACRVTAELEREFGQARKERRIIERLRERYMDEWSSEQAREDRKEDDRIAHRHQHARGDI